MVFKRQYGTVRKILVIRLTNRYLQARDLAPSVQRIKITMLTNGQIRTLKGWSNSVFSKVDFRSLQHDRFQALFYNKSKQDEFKQAYTLTVCEELKKWFGRVNRYESDSVYQQTHFETAWWARPLPKQIEILSSYLPGIQVDQQYLIRRRSDPIPYGFTKIAVSKFDFLERFLQMDDIYAQIGLPIRQICDLLEAKYAVDKSKEFCVKDFDADRVRCDERAVIDRKELEKKVPGDILILDVDLNNQTLGDKFRLCHSPRWSREEINHRNDLLHLSSVDIGWILLVNEKRLNHFQSLSIDSTFEEYLPPRYQSSLNFCFRGDQLRFDSRRAEFSYGHLAAGVALMPDIPRHLYPTVWTRDDLTI